MRELHVAGGFPIILSMMQNCQRMSVIGTCFVLMLCLGLSDCLAAELKKLGRALGVETIVVTEGGTR